MRFCSDEAPDANHFAGGANADDTYRLAARARRTRVTKGLKQDSRAPPTPRWCVRGGRLTYKPTRELRKGPPGVVVPVGLIWSLASRRLVCITVEAGEEASSRGQT